jgi:hypothetical protein
MAVPVMMHSFLMSWLLLSYVVTAENYLHIPYKKKKQSNMGKRDYHFMAPGKTSKIIGLNQIQ